MAYKTTSGAEKVGELVGHIIAFIVLAAVSAYIAEGINHVVLGEHAHYLTMLGWCAAWLCFFELWNARKARRG